MNNIVLQPDGNVMNYWLHSALTFINSEYIQLLQFGVHSDDNFINFIIIIEYIQYSITLFIAIVIRVVGIRSY
jgi:hypothetical protein